MLVGSCQQIVSIYGGLHMQPIGISYTFVFSQWYIHIHMYTPTCMKLNTYMQSYIYNIPIHIYIYSPWYHTHTDTYIYIYLYSHHIIYHIYPHIYIFTPYHISHLPTQNGVSSPLGLSVPRRWVAEQLGARRLRIFGSQGGPCLERPTSLDGATSRWFLLWWFRGDFSHQEIGFLWDF
jgi:hypothetical protein